MLSLSEASQGELLEITGIFNPTHSSMLKEYRCEKCNILLKSAKAVLQHSSTCDIMTSRRRGGRKTKRPTKFDDYTDSNSSSSDEDDTTPMDTTNPSFSPECSAVFSDDSAEAEASTPPVLKEANTVPQYNSFLNSIGLGMVRSTTHDSIRVAKM